MSSSNSASDIFLILSNFFILIGVRWAYKKKFFIESYILFQSGFVSAIYHSYSLFGHSRNLFSGLKFMDFYCAVLVIVALSVYAMDLESHNIKPIPILFLSSVLIFSLLVRDFDYIFEIAISSTCLLMIVVSYIVRRRIPRCKKMDCFLSLCFISAGLFCFHFGNDIGPYWLMHSFWHIMIMSSTYFILKVPIDSYIKVGKVKKVISNCRNIGRYFHMNETKEIEDEENNSIELQNKEKEDNLSI